MCIEIFTGIAAALIAISVFIMIIIVMCSAREMNDIEEELEECKLENLQLRIENEGLKTYKFFRELEDERNRRDR